MTNDVVSFLLDIFKWSYGIVTLLILCEIPLRIYVRVVGGKGGDIIK